MHPERRRRRSDSPAEASRLYLEALAARTRARSIVLADDDGLVVAGVGDDDHEVIAALGRAAAPRVHEAAVTIGGLPLKLFCVGGDAPPIDHTTSDLERILAA